MTRTIKPLYIKFTKVDKPKVIAPDSIRKITFKLFVRIKVKGAEANLKLGVFSTFELLLLLLVLIFNIKDGINPKTNKNITKIERIFIFISTTFNLFLIYFEL